MRVGGPKGPAEGLIVVPERGSGGVVAHGGAGLGSRGGWGGAMW